MLGKLIHRKLHELSGLCFTLLKHQKIKVGMIRDLLNSEVTVCTSSQPVRNYVKEYVVCLMILITKMSKVGSIKMFLLMEIGLDLLKIQYLS